MAYFDPHKAALERAAAERKQKAAEEFGKLKDWLTAKAAFDTHNPTTLRPHLEKGELKFSEFVDAPPAFDAAGINTIDITLALEHLSLTEKTLADKSRELDELTQALAVLTKYMPSTSQSVDARTIRFGNTG